MVDHPPTHPRVGVGCLVWKDGQVLLIRRGKPPGYGEWSLPGGSQELGETLFEAAEREVREETGIIARARSILTAVDNIVRDADGTLRFHYTIVDVTADWVSGDPVPGDDALDARWAPLSECEQLVGWEPLKQVLRTAFRDRP
ncbi:phosphohydrolase [Niveispirillum lacus]|uniref:Phosphohydrolase n=1 Tax=Niveispirillum lacus TaxID=1981099 RepID=A0A255Z4U7_9PROT|nr:NUDIX hydrolase [Niveispirillum lacus]OYQ36547.1 phosphohydrolase [Niveispirillum lacus]